MKKLIRWSLILGVIVLLIAACKDKGTNPEDQVFNLPDSNLTYIDHIKPLFVSKCASRSGCHATSDQEGGLDLTDYQAIRLHLINGTVPLVFSGEGATSPLYLILQSSYLNIPRMPLDGPYLNSNNTNAVKVWIDEGLNYSSN
jgi:hypothetical protein